MIKYFLTFIFTLFLGLFYFIYYPNVNVSKLNYSGLDTCSIEFNFPLMQDLKNEKIIKNDYFINKCDYRPSELIDDIKSFSYESHYLINKDKSLPYQSVYYFYFKNFSIQDLKNIIENHITFPYNEELNSTSQIEILSKYKLNSYIQESHNEVVLIIRLKNNADLEFSYFYANSNDIDLYSFKYQPYLKKQVYEF